MAHVTFVHYAITNPVIYTIIFNLPLITVFLFLGFLVLFGFELNIAQFAIFAVLFIQFRIGACFNNFAVFDNAYHIRVQNC